MNETDLANQALGIIGETRITSLDDPSAVAQTVKLFWPRVRDAVLRAHDWNCARARVTLVAITNPAAEDWTYAYQLPPDCLMVRRIAGYTEHPPFSLEGRTFLCDIKDAKIVYTARFIDVSQWDALLVDATATRLASEMASAGKARDLTMAQKLLGIYAAKVEEARGVDDAEGGIDESVDRTLTEVR